MRTFLSALVLLLPLTGAVAAPPSQPVDKLFSQLKQAERPEDAKPLESQILASFLRSGSASIDLLMTRAEAAITAGKKDVARHLLDEIVGIAPRFAEGWHRRGLLQQEAGEDGAAMVSLQKAVELNPRHFEAMTQLGEMLEDFGQKAEALKLYRRAIDLDPQFEGLQRHIDGLSRAVEGQGI
jgi:Flp pilus assembly protein TadD, contains TPR repeats